MWRVFSKASAIYAGARVAVGDSMDPDASVSPDSDLHGAFNEPLLGPSSACASQL